MHTRRRCRPQQRDRPERGRRHAGVDSGCGRRAARRPAHRAAVRRLPARRRGARRARRNGPLLCRCRSQGAHPAAAASGGSLAGAARPVARRLDRLAAYQRDRSAGRPGPRPAGRAPETWCRMTAIGFTAGNYVVQLAIPSLGGAALLVEHVEGDELISGLFTFRVRMIAENSALAFDSIVGKDAALSIGLPDGSKQYVHAIVGRFRQAGTTARFTTYFADLYPRMWLLTKTRDSRIFQNKSVPDIVKQVLQEHGVTDANDSLTRTYDPREYCVQYRETAFDFVSRLMEAEGISYYFTHTDSAHTLVLADDASSYTAGPAQLKIGATAMSPSRSDALPESGVEVQVTSDQCKLDDYNFETPTTDLLGTASGKTSALTVYDYPAGRLTKSAVEALATQRVEELELPRLLLHGSTSNAAIRPGHELTLDDHPRASANTKYVAWKVVHQASQDAYS